MSPSPFLISQLRRIGTSVVRLDFLVFACDEPAELRKRESGERTYAANRSICGNPTLFIVVLEGRSTLGRGFAHLHSLVALMNSAIESEFA
jgi:hypothetical protein